MMELSRDKSILATYELQKEKKQDQSDTDEEMYQKPQ